jgi:hypothetical protein
MVGPLEAESASSARSFAAPRSGEGAVGGPPGRGCLRWLSAFVWHVEQSVPLLISAPHDEHVSVASDGAILASSLPCRRKSIMIAAPISVASVTSFTVELG